MELVMMFSIWIFGVSLGLDLVLVLLVVMMSSVEVKSLMVGGFTFWGLGFGGDMMSMSLVVLSLWIVYMGLLGGGFVKNEGYFITLMLGLCMLFMGVFMSADLLLFYILFEFSLIPMFMLIMKYGYQPERMEGAVYMLLYTGFMSFPLLVGLLKLGEVLGSNSYFFCMLDGYKVSGGLWGLVLVSAFLVKLPMYGVHLWLPKAHVEAPVSGSMVLAGIMLKLGGYGLYRVLGFVNLGFCTQSVLMWSGVWGAVVSGVICLRQLDIKKLIAYSSVVHSGLLLGGLMTSKLGGFVGGMVIMVGHGLCSSGLFYMAGVMYKRLASRSLILSSGWMSLNGGMMVWWFLLVACNSAAPPFLNIFGEVMLGMSLISWVWSSSIVLGLLFFVSVLYGVFLYSVVSHGKAPLGLPWGGELLEYHVVVGHMLPLLILVFKSDLFVWV